MKPLAEFVQKRLVAMLGCLLLPAVLASQSPPQAPKIHVTTHLVQIGIIVRDKNGPVVGLSKDDFVVIDHGKPQKISVFTAESTASAPQGSPPEGSRPQSLLPNTFSDLPQVSGNTVRSVTIVLLDNLNTLSGNGHEGYETSPWWMEDLALTNAKAHLIEFIKTMDPKDRVAIYGLSDGLHVLCDFTNQRDRLLAILKHYDTTSRTNRDEVEPGKWHTPVPEEFNPDLEKQALELAGITNQRRAAQTMAALQSIASHVANIPGRKNLVWLTANLPFSGVALARMLGPAQIAAYPVDGRALLTRGTPENQWEIDDQLSGVLGLGMPAQFSQPIGIDTMQKLAEETGGRAFVNTNDLTRAIREAVEDSAVTYTLGFYINSDSLDGKFHELKVRAKQAGLNLRYPKGYYAFKDAQATQEDRHNGYLVAIQSPLESSSIPVTMRVVRVEKPLQHCLSLFGSIDIRKLRFAQSDGSHKGAVEVATIEQDETGKILRQSASRINFDFSEAKYSGYLKTGFPFHQFVQPQAGVTTLRIVVEDSNTAEVGSLIIPLSQVN